MRQSKISFNPKPFTVKPQRLHVSWSQDVEVIVNTTLNSSFFSQAALSKNLPSEIDPIIDKEFEEINKRYFYD